MKPLSLVINGRVDLQASGLVDQLVVAQVIGSAVAW